MIRDRRDEDLDVLSQILDELRGGDPVGRTSADWLHEVDADRSWVFDQAPVHVTPTRNVVGHVQIYRPRGATWIPDVSAITSRTPDDVLVVGRLFVKPMRHAYGIARYLLSQAVSFVEGRGLVAVLDPLDLEFVPSELVARLGFVALATDDVLVRRR